MPTPINTAPTDMSAAVTACRLSTNSARPDTAIAISMDSIVTGLS
jgi:hypothetical protein